MSDNPQPAPGANSGGFFALPCHRLVGIEGPDAANFAQAQFMNDLAPLAPGEWQWSGWLTPKGRVIVLFALIRLAPDALLLVLPDADAETFAAALRRFVFRSKVAVRVRDDLAASGRFAAPARARGAVVDGDLQSGLELDVGGDGGPRTLRIAVEPGPCDAVAGVRWREFDLAHGLPRLGPGQAEQWTPQQLSLERLRAFSVRKGCYPGQEIVARTHFLGHAKRALALLGTASAPADGSDVCIDGQPQGTIIASAGTLALAVLPLDRPAAPARIGDAPARDCPLLGGLAR